MPSGPSSRRHDWQDAVTFSFLTRGAGRGLTMQIRFGLMRAWRGGAMARRGATTGCMQMLSLIVAVSSRGRDKVVVVLFDAVSSRCHAPPPADPVCSGVAQPRCIVLDRPRHTGPYGAVRGSPTAEGKRCRVSARCPHGARVIPADRPGFMGGSAETAAAAVVPYFARRAVASHVYCLIGGAGSGPPASAIARDGSPAPPTGCR